jgi:hypothetical protein
MENFAQRIDHAYTQIAAVKNKVARRDLMIMLRATETAYTHLDRESVECRRLGRPTSRYTELHQNCQQLVDNLEKNITFASLLP